MQLKNCRGKGSSANVLIIRYIHFKPIIVLKNVLSIFYLLCQEGVIQLVAASFMIRETMNSGHNRGKSASNFKKKKISLANSLNINCYPKMRTPLKKKKTLQFCKIYFLKIKCCPNAPLIFSFWWLAIYSFKDQWTSHQIHTIIYFTKIQNCSWNTWLSKELWMFK